MASQGLEGVSKVPLVSLNQPWPFEILHTLINTGKQFNSSLATRIFLCTFLKFFSVQNILFYHASHSTLCISQHTGLLSIFKISTTIHMVHQRIIKVLTYQLSLADGTPQRRVALLGSQQR